MIGANQRFLRRVNMIVCSCNVFSDAQVRAAIAGSVERPRVSRVYSSLGCAAQVRALRSHDQEHD
jgi:hypothetical protein